MRIDIPAATSDEHTPDEGAPGKRWPFIGADLAVSAGIALRRAGFRARIFRAQYHEGF